jgi:phosphate starvation-inducible membrane PsiE
LWDLLLHEIGNCQENVCITLFFCRILLIFYAFYYSYCWHIKKVFFFLKKYPVKKVSFFLRNWNASRMPSYRLQSASSLWKFYMWLPLLEAIDLKLYNRFNVTLLHFLYFPIFSHVKHNFKSEFHLALIKFTILHLVKFL